jgi:hypothetical protein
MKRLHFASLLGLIFIGQAYGASSSNSLQLPPVNYTGTFAQLANINCMPLPHKNIPKAFSQFCSSGGFSRNEPSQFEETMKPIIPGLFRKFTRNEVISAATASQAYTHHRLPNKNIYDYLRWSSGFAALLGSCLWVMHETDVLAVNWKHILLCASLASAAGIYGSWDDISANNSEKQDIINLRTDPEKMIRAVRRLAEGFTERWQPNSKNEEVCNPVPVYEGYFNQHKLGADVTADYRSWMKSSSPAPHNAEQLPLRNLKKTKIDDIKDVYQHVYNHLWITSTNRLGTIYSAENIQYTIPVAIPCATTAALLVSGIALIRDFRLSRIQ